MGDENTQVTQTLINVVLTKEHEHNGVLHSKGTKLSLNEADAAFIVDVAKAGEPA